MGQRGGRRGRSRSRLGSRRIERMDRQQGHIRHVIDSLIGRQHATFSGDCFNGSILVDINTVQDLVCQFGGTLDRRTHFR